MLLTLGGAAHAADKKARVDADEQKARDLYKQGQRAYDVGEFDRALTLYSDAYKLKSLPGFLFNIAQCHRQKGNFKDAAFFFGRFIDNTTPSEPNVERARELLEDMNRRASEKAEADRRADEVKLAEDKRLAAEAAAKQAADAPKVAPLEPALTSTALPPPPPPPEEETPVYKKGVFWVVVGAGVVAVAGGTAAAVALSKGSGAKLPPTSLSDINGR